MIVAIVVIVLMFLLLSQCAARLPRHSAHYPISLLQYVSRCLRTVIFMACAHNILLLYKGKLCHFFTKARCECLLPLPHGPPNPCKIFSKMVPNGRGGTSWRALSAPKRPKGSQERSQRPPETAKKRLQERLGALFRRFGRPGGHFERGFGTQNEDR